MLVPMNFALVEGGYVKQSVVRVVEDEGPPPPAAADGDWRLLPAPIDWAAPPGARLKWMGFDVMPEWEPPALADLQAEAIAKTYGDVDAVYDAAVGRRATEYQEAEAAARAYLAAEVEPTVVSEYITGHAQNNPTGQQQTNGWAARQIIERADAFRWAALQMRTVRFARQADMRAATATEELAAAVAEWEEFLTWLRSTLDL